ncbi:MAG TPA: hypothetical protein VI997_02305 [Candidatus Thermoplasmatota archaeon]|nr:hypothetical protein [Candidatus Thermoplasmatota archaeon]
MDDAPFRAAYERDATNRAKQAWDEYAKWIRTFYEGKAFPPVPGWTKRERDILAALPDAARPQAARLLDELGRRMAAEWAKDNAVRKVSTGDLQAWGSALEKAARGDADGARTIAQLETQLAELAKRGA